MEEEILEKLEELATQLDDGDHGKTPHATHIADLIEEITAHYREILGE